MTVSNSLPNYIHRPVIPAISRLKESIDRVFHQDPYSKIKKMNIEAMRHFHAELLQNGSTSLFSRCSIFQDEMKPTIAGMEILASQLILKHKLPQGSIVVCKNEEDFNQKFSTFNSENKTAFIVEKSGGHYVTVLVQKRADGTHAALMDSLGKSDNFIRYSVNIHLSKVVRQQKRGCWVFALKDAVAFFKEPDFFGTVQSQEIHLLPWRFMVTSQRPKNEAEAQILGPHGNFDRKWKKHERMDRVTSGSASMPFNLRISHFSVSYLSRLSDVLKAA